MKQFVIHQRSWHYRLYCWFENPWPLSRMGGTPPKHKEPTNLCGYVWKLFGHTAFYPLWIIALPLIVLVLVLFMAGATVVCVAFHQPWDAWMTAFDKDQSREKQPGLIRSYFAAKKAKICPLVIVEHEK